MKQNEHGKILAAAAKRRLLPLGCRRIGQSRTWLLDHGWWLVQIEFQPSGWSRGSYLNVGAHWLWKYKPGSISFDYNDRIENFVSFESSEQFEPEADRLAARAAEETLKLSNEFSSIGKAANILQDLAANAQTAWPIYHAAIATGLEGEISVSRQLFEQLRIKFAHHTQPIEADLVQLLSRPDDYAAAIETMIADQRRHNKLPICPNPLSTPAACLS